jgi:hypothetical protein
MHANEALERAEHAGQSHAGHHQPSSGKLIGLTMGLIAVLIAFCAAMVGSERNELIRAMIEQTQAHSDYSAASTKFRLIMIEAEKQRGDVGDDTESASTPAPKAEADPGAVKAFLRRLLRLYQDYASERKLSKAWSDNYQPLVDAHFEAAEGYERAQLVAEIGIVVASLAVLLTSRTAWFASIVLAALCVVQLGKTYLHTRDAVNTAIKHVRHSEEAYQEVRKAHTNANEDEAAIEALDPGGKMRATLSPGEAKHE